MPADLAAFVALETQVWQALVDGDAGADERLLSVDFLGVYPSGFSDRAGHVDQLVDGPSVASFELDDARLLDVAEEAVMLSYRATYRRTTSASPEAMYVSSLWCRRGDGWINIFSQDTPAD